MPERKIIVRSVDQFVREVCDIREQWTRGGEYFDPWFRGQGNSSWPLVPSLYRANLQDEEDTLRLEFIRRGTQMVDGRLPKDDWEWYFLMQHYRCPTRLLDWTDSALVALFFAINSSEPSQLELDGNPGVWVLDPWWLNRTVIHLDSIVDPGWSQTRPYLREALSGPPRPKLPIAIDPPHVARRIAVQRSRFTIHGSAPRGIELAARTKKSRFKCIEIDAKKIARIRCDLYTCGITDATVFPDLEGLGRELSRTAQSEW